MTRLILFLCLSLLSVNATAQDQSELDKRNGFKDIKLGMPVDSVKGATLKKEFTEKGNVHPSAIYEVKHADYESIGDIAVKEVELKSYRGLIYEITVVTDKDPRLMKAMENVLGLATYDAKQNLYFWKTDQLVLTYESHSKKELQLLYKSFVVPKMMKEDKEKKIENIADDF